jgi:hypothetical protein
MVFKWRDEYIDPFLDEYRQQDCLWNISSDSYKNRDTRDKAYESIYSALNLPGLSVNDIKTKIKTIDLYSFLSDLCIKIHLQLQILVINVY